MVNLDSSATPPTTAPPRSGAARRRRRPSGEAPPLPRNLASARYWLILTGVVLTVAAALWLTGAWVLLTRADIALLRGLTALRSEPVTTVMQALHALGSQWTIRLLAWGTVLALVVFKRWRHLAVLAVSLAAVHGLATLFAWAVARPRPGGIERLAPWNGFSSPSRPVAVLAVVLIGMCYTLFVQGRWRERAKWVAGGLIAALGIARMYLGIDHPSDVLFGVMLGVTVPLVAFRLLTPNAVFPVTYLRRRTAHLPIDTRRETALRNALRDQLGVNARSIAAFNLEGSFGSTPLKIEVDDEAGTVLFGKLYAASHMRADRWYKLWRTLRYGRLEDEKAFNTVRRLVQYEDYMLRVMRDAGLRVAEPYGFVEITPEREYLLVTEFITGAHESSEVDLDEAMIDDALRAVQQLWHVGLAHRDIKPANVMFADGRAVLIDVAFGQIRPSPWRQAVDLANMMIVLALRTSPELVYQRALQFFSADEIAEAFAATSEATRPSLHRMMRADGRDLLGQFRKLAPERPRIKIQRWSARRIGLTVVVLIGGALGIALVIENLRSAGLYDEPLREYSADSEGVPPLADDPLVPECADPGRSNFLMAQSLPRASLVPCLAAQPPGWSLAGTDIRSGGSTLRFNSDRAGPGALAVEFRPACDVAGAVEVPSDEEGARRYEKVESLVDRYRGTRTYVFAGGCTTYRFDTQRDGWTALGNDASGGLGFTTREQLARVYRDLTHGLQGP